MLSDGVNFYTKPLERFFLARRRTSTRSSLSRDILKITCTLSNWQGCSPLNYSPSLQRCVELSESGINDYMLRLQDTLKGFILSDHPQTPQIILCAHTGEYNEDQDFFFSLPNNTRLERLPTKQFMSLIARICEGFNATSGNVHDNYLGRLFGYEKRAYERSILEVGVGNEEAVPKSYQIPGVKDILPELLIMDEFDYHVVPNLIWWINFWSHEMIQVIGSERIRSAPWAHQVELSDGSMVLASTDSPTDVHNMEHLEILSEITQTLRLRELQEAYRS